MDHGRGHMDRRARVVDQKQGRFLTDDLAFLGPDDELLLFQVVVARVVDDVVVELVAARGHLVAGGAFETVSAGERF